jgi:hypothetical protein
LANCLLRKRKRKRNRKLRNEAKNLASEPILQIDEQTEHSADAFDYGSEGLLFESARVQCLSINDLRKAQQAFQ